MSLFRRRSEPSTTEKRSVDLSGYSQLWGALLPYSPVAVGRETALTHAASSACIDTLSTSVSSLPIDVLRSSGEMRIPVEPTPTLIARPSSLVAQDVWLYQLMQSMLTDGNAFGVVTSWLRGSYPGSIELVDPEIVGDRRIDSNGVPSVTLNGERHALYPYGDIWHVPGRFVMPGTPFACSPVTRARATIGAAIAARDFGSRFFGDGAHPGAIITADQELSKEQAKDIKASFINAMRGTREPAVFGSGLTYQQVTTNPDDSQFIELMRFAIEEACRFWRVPPSMVYAATSGESVTYANVSQADLAYLKHSLEGHLVRIERALTDLLPRPQQVRFNRNAFLRSDPSTRSEIVDRRLKNKTMSVNQAKALEDELPWSDPSFDEPGIPGVVGAGPVGDTPPGGPNA